MTNCDGENGQFKKGQLQRDVITEQPPMIIRFFSMKNVDQKLQLSTLEKIDAFPKIGDNCLGKLIGSKRSACLKYNSNSFEFLVLETKQMFYWNSSYISVHSVSTFYRNFIVYCFTKFSDRCSENAREIKSGVEYFFYSI